MSESDPISEAIVEMYEGGMSRSEIYDTFEGLITEYQIRKESANGDPNEHNWARREARESLKSRNLSHSDYYLAMHNKMVGRGQRIGANKNLLNKDEISKYWESADKAEGSP